MIIFLTISNHSYLLDNGATPLSVSMTHPQAGYNVNPIGKFSSIWRLKMFQLGGGGHWISSGTAVSLSTIVNYPMPVLRNTGPATGHVPDLPAKSVGGLEQVRTLCWVPVSQDTEQDEYAPQSPQAPSGEGIRP